MVAFDAHKNFARSLVATAPSPSTSGTSLTVTSGEGSRFPATPFNAVVCAVGRDGDPVYSEIITVTGRTGDVLSPIVRAQETGAGGPSARAIVVGDQITVPVTAKTLTDIEAKTSLAIATKTTAYTLTDADDVILADASSGAITLTLPAVATRTRPYYVKKIDIGVNAVTIDGNGTEPIDDQLTFSFNDLYGAFMFIPSATKWWVF